jgi:hypothetical protein
LGTSPRVVEINNGKTIVIARVMEEEVVVIAKIL